MEIDWEREVGLIRSGIYSHRRSHVHYWRNELVD